MDVVTTVDTYVAAWNEFDDAKRAALLDVAFADDGRIRSVIGFFGPLD